MVFYAVCGCLYVFNSLSQECIFKRTIGGSRHLHGEQFQIFGLLYITLNFALHLGGSVIKGNRWDKLHIFN